MLYVIAFGVDDGGDTIGVTSGFVFFGVLDVLNVPVVAAAVLILSRKWDFRGLNLYFTQVRYILPIFRSHLRREDVGNFHPLKLVRTMKTNFGVSMAVLLKEASFLSAKRGLFSLQLRHLLQRLSEMMDAMRMKKRHFRSARIESSYVQCHSFVRRKEGLNGVRYRGHELPWSGDFHFGCCSLGYAVDI